MPPSFVNSPSEPGPDAQIRDCRYGHGALTPIDSFGGKPVVFSMFFSFPDGPNTSPHEFGPFKYYVCSRCGYTEFVDTTPSVSIEHLEKE